MAPSCIISDIYRDIGRKSPFFIPPCIRRPRYTVCYKEKLECCGYLTVKKFDDICITVFFRQACMMWRTMDSYMMPSTDRQTSFDSVVRAVHRAVETWPIWFFLVIYWVLGFRSLKKWCVLSTITWTHSLGWPSSSSVSACIDVHVKCMAI